MPHVAGPIGTTLLFFAERVIILRPGKQSGYAHRVTMVQRGKQSDYADPSPHFQ